jgi:hypothetical protein
MHKLAVNGCQKLVLTLCNKFNLIAQYDALFYPVITTTDNDETLCLYYLLKLSSPLTELEPDSCLKDLGQSLAIGGDDAVNNGSSSNLRKRSRPAKENINFLEQDNHSKANFYHHKVSFL